MNDDAKKTTNLADQKLDVWGHLPQNRRKEMDAYNRERFMPRYSDISQQYYRSISEQSQRKDD